MKCPVCEQVMEKVRQDISYNPNQSHKEYDRIVYECKADDIWVTSEIPRTESDK